MIRFTKDGKVDRYLWAMASPTERRAQRDRVADALDIAVAALRIIERETMTAGDASFQATTALRQIGADDADHLAEMIDAEMKLDELKKLAQAATPVLRKRFASYDCEALSAFHSACEPEQIIAMIDLLRYATHMDRCDTNDNSSDCGCGYLSARAKLEQQE